MLFRVFFLLLLSTSCHALPLETIKVPPGFKIDIFADELDNARSMSLSDKGIVYVGSRRAGNVYALLDSNKDGRADKRYTLAKGLNMPNGVAWHQGDLYVAEIHRVLKFENIDAQLDKPPSPKVIFDKLPRLTHHGWRYIKFGPDDELYIAVGAPCNVCTPSNEVFGTITRMNKDGSEWEVYSHGVRNSVGFDWHPVTKLLWLTDNGRDYMGDDLPADELNIAREAGLHFGFPFCHQGNLPDPKFGELRPCADFVPPAYQFQAHVAALGIRFYTGSMFPSEYQNQAFVAQHGSWNRSSPVGYRVVSLKTDNNQASEFEVFASGWLQGEKAWGRPVDVAVQEDGSLLVSDDLANAIYRITYATDE